jgi:hypothetical protein
MKAQDIKVGETYAVAFSVRKNRPTKWYRVVVTGEGRQLEGYSCRDAHFPVIVEDGTKWDIGCRDFRKTWTEHEMSS